MAKAVPKRSRAISRPTMLGICIFLAAITWLVFGRTLGHGFINYDDEIYVYENPQVAAGLTLHGIIWAFTHTVCANWHPLTVISHMLDCTLYGLNASGHHFTNVFLHTVAVVLLFLVVSDMTGAVWRSAFVAALFAIHPLRVESVAWVSERKDILSALFFVLTLAAYVRYVRAPSLQRYLLVTLLFALGLMCKPMLVTLPFVLLLLDYWPLERFTRSDSSKYKSKNITRWKRLLVWWHCVVEKIPLMLLSAASCLATLLAQRQLIHPSDKLSLTSRIANALTTPITYIWQMVWPRDLAVFYPHPKSSLSIPAIALSFVLLAALSIGVLVLRRTRPYLLTGWFWYLGMLVPVIGLVQVGLQGHADRYTYLPQIGLYLVITWAIADLSSSWRYRRIISNSLAIVVLTGFAICAWLQTAHWRDSDSLWTHALAVTSDNDVAHNGLCNAFLREGRVDDAISQAEIALKLRPDSADAHSNLGIALSRKGRLDEALDHFQKVLEINRSRPRLHYNFATALLQKGEVDAAITHYRQELEIQPDYVEAHTNLGIALSRKGQLDEALSHLQKASEIDVNRPGLHYNLANVLLQKGEVDQAIAQYQKELQIQPGYAQAHNDLGIALSQKGRMNEAIAEWQTALDLEPNNTNAECNLAWVFATYPDTAIRDGTKAVKLASRASAATGGNNPRILRLLAAAYAESGLFPEAIEVAERALQLATTQGNFALAEMLQGNIALYRSSTPLRDTAYARR
jgi:tetratricopeptide (TPR) repeat protein